MAQNMQLTTAVRNALLTNLISNGTTGNTAVIYSGTAPADANTALSGNTALATFTLDNTMGTVASAVLTITKGGTAISSGNKLTATASATGTATFFRVLTGTTVIWQGTCGTATSDMILNTVSITSGGPVECTSWTVTAPGA